MKMNLDKGDVIDVNLGQPPKEIQGHEQGFIRPCAVIKAFNSMGLVVVVPLTSKEPKYALFSVVKIKNGTAGLTADSFALCHQIRTISMDRVLKKRGALGGRDFTKIQAVLLDTLEL